MRGKTKKGFIGIVISIYFACSILLILNLPTIFFNFITWIGCEEIKII